MTSAYLVGSARAFGYDESVTVAHFVRTPSLLDPFRKQVVYNNHVAFSFFEHVVASVTGHSGEVWMRVLPALFAGLGVAILVAVLAQTASRWIAISAGTILATNPLYIAAGRSVRGYSLLCLCAIASSLVLFRLLSAPSRAKRVGYVALLALGVATQLYMVFVIAGHLCILVARRELNPRWVATLTVAIVLGASAYIGVGESMVHADRGHAFYAAFPRDLIRALLGSALLAVLITGLGLAIAVWTLRQRRELRLFAAMSVAVVLALWAVVQPLDLYPRFFVWLVPGIATAAAFGLSRLRHRLLASAAVVLIALSAVASVIPSYAKDELANASFGSRMRSAQARGQVVCGIGNSMETLAPYVPRVHAVFFANQLAGCDVVVALQPHDNPAAVAAAYRHFAHHHVESAEYPGIIFWS